VLNVGDPESFQKKYHQLYLPEHQRAAYLKTVQAERPTELRRRWSSKIQLSYLGNSFRSTREFSIETFNQGSPDREVVEGLVDVLQGYDIDSLQDYRQLGFHDFYTTTIRSTSRCTAS